MIDQVINIGTYIIAGLLIVAILIIYIRKQKRESKNVIKKIARAKADGMFEPVTLHPVIDANRCIKSGACVTACPEGDIIGIRDGRATVINASICIGHGACLLACPVEAISLFIGTEKRGVDLPELNPDFQTNVSGLFVAGELGGMGLIKNAVIQGREAMENIAKMITKNSNSDYDVVVVGAGPAGISATLTARKLGLKVLTLEQESLGGTVFTFPRHKIVMTSPMDLPLYGKVKLVETTKAELLSLWNDVLGKNQIQIKENSKVEEIIKTETGFEVKTQKNESFNTQTVLLAIGRRGTPRKLNVPGEMTEKVAYRLIEPEDINNKNVLVVGGGDSAVESALMLAEHNHVTISYRGERFTRLKQKNTRKILDAIENKSVDVIFNSQIKSIETNAVTYVFNDEEEIRKLDNDLVFVFAGGELPSDFLKKTGIRTSTKHGEAILKRR